MSNFITLYPTGDFTASLLPLGLSNVLNSHKQVNVDRENALKGGQDKPDGVLPHNSGLPRARRGQKGISGYGRRMVRSAAHILQCRHTRKLLSFVTTTLPGLDDCELAMCSQEWAEITRQFMQELKRLLNRKGLDGQWVHVSEIQEKRWKRRGELAPHLHIVFQGRKDSRSGWAVAPNEIKEIWHRILSNFCGRDIDCNAATRIEQVRHNASYYLSKYMSKGGKVIEEIVQSGLVDCLPTAWYGMNNALRTAIKKAMFYGNEAQRNLLVDNLESLKEIGYLKWYFIIEDSYIEQHGEMLTRPVGLVGEFCNQARAIEILSIAA